MSRIEEDPRLNDAQAAWLKAKPLKYTDGTISALAAGASVVRLLGAVVILDTLRDPAPWLANLAAFAVVLAVCEMLVVCALGTVVVLAALILDTAKADRDSRLLLADMARIHYRAKKRSLFARAVAEVVWLTPFVMLTAAAAAGYVFTAAFLLLSWAYCRLCLGLHRRLSLDALLHSDPAEIEAAKAKKGEKDAESAAHPLRNGSPKRVG